MTIKKAQQELARPLVFGDALQIKALKILDRERKTEAVRSLLIDYLGIDDEFLDAVGMDKFMDELQATFPS